MKNICNSHHCVSCCYDTEMLLLDEDILRITRLGYEEEFFTRESKGFKILKNSRHGRCVFHDGTLCTIYKDRPKGCSIYPIIFDEDLMSPVKDNLCPHMDEFVVPKKTKLELSNVYTRLLSERLDRKAMK
ncbi:MAG: YkgJ family cysteine cluster protein [Nitrososphaerota archaeon]|nr:YkgJ family cysteine cluster protein [Nitrososphaerota archaeon]